MDKLFLLDAYALIYRAYYAFIKNPRINSKGMNTSAISPPKAHTSDITSRKPTAYPEKNDTNLRLTPMRTVQRNDANHDTNGSTMNVTLTILKKNATAATAPERHTSHALSLDAPLWKAIIDKVSNPAE